MDQAKPNEMVQFRGRNASLWQSAIDQATAKRNSSSPAAGFGAGPGATHLQRPQQTDAGIQAGNELASLMDVSAPIARVEPPATTSAGLVDTVKFCSTTAYHL